MTADCLPHQVELHEWRRRDAHEFVLATSLGIAFFLDASYAIGLLCVQTASFNPKAVIIFLQAFFGAYLAYFLAYSLFVAARWLPPAAQCYCCSAIPSAIFRLLALLACLLCAASAVCELLPVLATAPWRAQPAEEGESAEGAVLGEGAVMGEGAVLGEGAVALTDLLSSAGLLAFWGIELLCYLAAAAAVTRRLGLQAFEDNRPWFSFGPGYPSRRSHHWNRADLM